MSDYDNNMRGVLFRNERKEKDTQPDYRGTCEVDGKPLEISAWVRQIKNGANAGKNMLSLAFREPYQGPGAEQGAPADDRMPF